MDSKEEVKEVPQEEKQVQEVAPGEDLSTLFVNLDEGVPTDEIESLCMDCREQGKTRFMYTKIPMFKEIILSSFYCDHCGNKNTEVQFGGKLADKGVKYEFKVTSETAINRSVVKSEFATIRIPELDFEIPPQTQKGSINTIEGFFAKSIEGISELQEQRRKYDPAVAAKLDEFIMKLEEYKDGRHLPFTFMINDPSGNSFVQNPDPSNIDPNLKVEHYLRSIPDFQSMGYNVDEAALYAEQEAKENGIEREYDDGSKKFKESAKAVIQTKDEQEALLAKVQAYAKRGEPEITANYMDFSKPVDDKDNVDAQEHTENQSKELMTFPTMCDACTSEGEVRMCTATIPFFKEIIIMAFSCEKCGHKSSEIKQGGGISDKATKITFNFQHPDDLNRDIFKSDTTFLKVPELDMELQPGTLGSMYTTIEGILDKIVTHLEEVNPFGKGDSKTESDTFLSFLDKLRVLKEGNKPFTLELDDPLSNCFIYNPKAPQEDPQIRVEVYERTAEQDDELGISDMNV